jgi:hypothetical protein
LNCDGQYCEWSFEIVHGVASGERPHTIPDRNPFRTL